MPTKSAGYNREKNDEFRNVGSDDAGPPLDKSGAFPKE